MASGKAFGIRGSAVFAGTVGLYLAYVGVKDVPFFEGLRQLFRKQTPQPRKQHDKFTFDQIVVNANQGTAPDIHGIGLPANILLVPGVPGLYVDKSIKDNVYRLFLQAEKDGLKGLGGGGYRNSFQQAQLRITNGCPDMSSPSDTCRVPTAPVGHSEHEKGLAIDFTINGRVIKRDFVAGQVAFAWLVKNAPRYGLKNLPSEPWHWSTTGR